MAIGYCDRSSVIGTVGLAVAAIAIVGTQVLGWEWGSGPLLPTIIGVAVAALAVVVVLRRLSG